MYVSLAGEEIIYYLVTCEKYVLVACEPSVLGKRKGLSECLTVQS